MNLHRSGIQRERLDPDAHQLLGLQWLKNAVQHTVLGPTVHAHVNRVPGAEPLRQPAPLATLFGHIQNCVQNLEVTQTDVATLHWQAILDPRILRFGELNLPNILTLNCFISVNTP